MAMTDKVWDRIFYDADAEFERARRNKTRRERDSVMRSLGLVKVRGALGTRRASVLRACRAQM